MTKQISAEEFDTRFDNGEEMDDYLDLDNAIVENSDPKNILIALPTWVIEVAEQEAKRRNVSRRALLNMWICDKADETRMVLRHMRA